MRRWPVPTFFVLAFVITWVVWLPRAFGIDWAVGVGTFWTYAPAVAAVVTAVLVGGRPELRQLLSGLDKWRIGWVWYAVILFGPLALGLLVATVNVALGGNWEDGMPEVFSETLPIILLLLVILTITDGLGEELGWRGFGLPKMLERQSAFAASIVLGLVWAIWHLPLIWTDGSSLEGTYWWLLLVRASRHTGAVHLGLPAHQRECRSRGHLPRVPKPVLGPSPDPGGSPHPCGRHTRQPLGDRAPVGDLRRATPPRWIPTTAGRETRRRRAKTSLTSVDVSWGPPKPSRLTPGQ